MSNAAFEDLDIDTAIMMTDPLTFSDQVTKAAESLKEVLKADTSIQALTRQMEDSGTPADQTFNVLANAIYNISDEYPVEQMPAIIELARQLVRDLETAFRDRLIIDSSKDSKGIKDKRLAHAMYKDLREAYNDYIGFMNSFFKKKLNGKELKPLPPMPGNFGPNSSGLRHLVFQIGEDVYRQPAAVCRKLGVDIMHMYDDFLAFIEEHPEHNIIVKEVTL